MLEEPTLSFEGINSSLTEAYMSSLIELRHNKVRQGEFCAVLTHSEIQNCINLVCFRFVLFYFKNVFANLWCLW